MPEAQELKHLESACGVIRQSICMAHQAQHLAFEDLLEDLSKSSTIAEAVMVIDSLHELLDQHGGDQYIVARAYLNQLRNDFSDND